MNPFDDTRLVGKILNNRYRIDRRIGGGAVATVFQGTDLKTDTRVAIKQLMDTAKQADDAQITRFERESNAMEELSHPNIVNVLDTIFDDGDHFIVMDHVAGGSLYEMLERQGKLDIPYALKLGHDIASAMVVVHNADIIHRDIKPDNILISREGHARLTDFGMARFTYMSRLTQKDMMIGSMMYMAPEQYRTGEAILQSDIWAFGIVLYEMIAGTKPFKGPHLIITGTHTPLIETRPEVSPQVSALLDKLLEKDHRDRIQSFEEVRAALETLMKS